MARELSLALVQADAVGSPEEFGRQMQTLVQQCPSEAFILIRSGE